MKIAGKSLVVGALVLFAGAMCVAAEADARGRAGGARGNAHARAHARAHAHVRNVHVNRNVRRGGRWVNGVWVAGGAAAVAAGAASGGGCAYYYRKWKETGSAYWRNQYYASCN
jgi:hypothetical protein